MKKSKAFSATLCSLFISIYACSTPNTNPTPSPSSSVTINSTPTPSESIHPSASVTPSKSPNPSSSPVQQKYTYSLPLRITNIPECNGLGDPKTTYEINEDGTYTFVSLTDSTKMDSRKLSDTEIQSLKQLLQDLDIAGLSESDKVVPPGTPQTTECRTIENYTMNVNDSQKTYDRNGRNYIHTQEYFDALTKLKNKLDELKNANPDQKYLYSLPLRITISNECPSVSSLRILYEVKDDGTFTYITNENDLNMMDSRKLNSDEINDLKNTLVQANIATYAEKDTAIPTGSIQTDECRDIENYTMTVNGTEKSYDRNGRQYTHTTDYLNALMTIKNKLIDLSKK